MCVHHKNTKNSAIKMSKIHDYVIFNIIRCVHVTKGITNKSEKRFLLNYSYFDGSYSPSAQFV